AENTFLTSGYANWKNAIGRNGGFEMHQKTNCHTVATQALQNLRSTAVSSLLSHQISLEQATARKCLTAVVTSIVFVARQGLALRHRDDNESNLNQLLSLRAADVPELGTWLSRRQDYTHHSIQN